MGFFSNIYHKIFPATYKENIEDPFVVEEVMALIRYASDNGIDPGGDTLATLKTSITNYTDLDIMATVTAAANLGTGDKFLKVAG